MDFATLMDSQSGMLYRIVYELLNWIGCNKGKAKNADDAGNGGK